MLFRVGYFLFFTASEMSLQKYFTTFGTGKTTARISYLGFFPLVVFLHDIS
jgi:hypothetical protein